MTPDLDALVIAAYVFADQSRSLRGRVAGAGFGR